MSTPRIQKILDMMLMQDTINRQIDEDWAVKDREWYRAVWIECGELMEHYGGWKWWKKDSPDMEQVLLEIVDIWHFGLSSLLVTNHDMNLIAARVEKEWDTIENDLDFHTAVERLAENALNSKTFPVPEFSSILRACGLSFEDLYKSYIGKNVLNRFRQNFGYKTGDYIKHWNGKEDNEVLSQVLSDLDLESENFENKIYSILEAKYPGSSI